MYAVTATNYWLSDGRRELTRTQFLTMAPPLYSPSSTMTCVYIGPDHFLRHSDCADLRQPLCEFKGNFYNFQKKTSKTFLI
jgi:hypothetical protein